MILRASIEGTTDSGEPFSDINERTIAVFSTGLETFVQTDKPVYKAGQIGECQSHINGVWINADGVSKTWPFGSKRKILGGSEATLNIYFKSPLNLLIRTITN